MTADAKWTAREATPADVPLLHELAKACHDNSARTVPIKYGVEHTRWQMLEAPAGVYRGLVAIVDGRPAGFYGVVPMRVRCDGRESLAALSLLTMTHPQYRGRGIFRGLATRLYADLARYGFAFVYGFPNDNSQPTFLSALGWTHTCDWPVFVRPLNLPAIARRVLQRRWVPGPDRPESRGAQPAVPAAGGLREVERFDERMSAFRAGWEDGRRVYIARSAAYMNWRYAACPDWRYRKVIAESGQELTGYVVWRHVEEYGLKGAMIMDLAAAAGRLDVLRDLVRVVVGHARRDGMDLVSCLPAGHVDTQRALRRSLFAKVPERLSPKKWHFGGRRLDSTMPAEYFNAAASWHIGFGDCDVM